VRSPYAVKELTRPVLSWRRGSTQLDAEGRVTAALFPVSSSMSPLSDEQVPITFGVDDPVVEVHFLITAERMIVQGARPGASMVSATLRLARVPNENVFGLTFGCTDTNLTSLEGVHLNTSAFTALYHSPVLAAAKQGSLLELSFEVSGGIAQPVRCCCARQGLSSLPR
jgi:hypothetical protein